MSAKPIGGNGFVAMGRDVWGLHFVKRWQSAASAVRRWRVRAPAALAVAGLLLASSCGQQGGDARTDHVQETRAAHDGARLALVIGVGRYSQAIGALENPVRDADLIAAALTAQGFTVKIIKDPDRRALTAALNAFSSDLDAAGENVTGLIYFAGHGLQVNGVNYVLPRDAEAPEGLTKDTSATVVEASLSDAFLPAERLLRALGERTDGVSILVLDACRDNNLVRSIARQKTRGAFGSARSLADKPLEADDMLIAYATGPGEFSYDGGGVNSPFAAALAEEMRGEGTAYEVLTRVRARVRSATEGRQRPLFTGALAREFCFSSCDGAHTDEGRPEDGSADSAEWAFAVRKNTPASYEGYLERFPEGRRLAEARAAIANLEKIDEEAAGWRRAADAGAPGLRRYLADNPDGAHKDEASVRLRSLEAAALERAQQAGTSIALIEFLRVWTGTQDEAQVRRDIDRLGAAERQAAATPPAPTGSKTAAGSLAACGGYPFVVYFERDSERLTGANSDTIRAATARAKVQRCTIARVEVVGFSDTAASFAQSLAISERRAAVVRDALVLAGVDGALIETSARGETGLAESTRDGVLNPLNRRAEVTFIFQR